MIRELNTSFVRDDPYAGHKMNLATTKMAPIMSVLVNPAVVEMLTTSCAFPLEGVKVRSAS